MGAEIIQYLGIKRLLKMVVGHCTPPQIQVIHTHTDTETFIAVGIFILMPLPLEDRSSCEFGTLRSLNCVLPKNQMYPLVISPWSTYLTAPLATLLFSLHPVQNVSHQDLGGGKKKCNLHPDPEITDCGDSDAWTVHNDPVALIKLWWSLSQTSSALWWNKRIS